MIFTLFMILIHHIWPGILGYLSPIRPFILFKKLKLEFLFIAIYYLPGGPYTRCTYIWCLTPCHFQTCSIWSFLIYLITLIYTTIRWGLHILIYNTGPIQGETLEPYTNHTWFSPRRDNYRLRNPLQIRGWGSLAFVVSSHGVPFRIEKKLMSYQFKT